MKNVILIFTLGCFFIIGCTSSDVSSPSENPNTQTPPETVDDSWLIDKNLVLDGGPGKDGIPALNNPGIVRATDAVYMKDDDLIIGFKDGDDMIAYPHKILDWHEIINVDVNNVSMAIIYCPLTGTGVGWNRQMPNNVKTTFGVSGLLYKNNIIPYDRATDSNWSQLRLECVNGELKGRKSDDIVLIEMKWGLWKEMYPQTLVISDNTGFNRNYDEYPYGSYKINNNFFIFPIEPLIGNVPAKERVHVIIADDEAKYHRFRNFSDANIRRYTFQNKEYLTVGNQEFMVSFELNSLTSDLIFEYKFDGTEVILTDNEGNNWNVFGEALSGPRKGNFLNLAKTSMMAYYFSLESFYPGAKLFD